MNDLKFGTGDLPAEYRLSVNISIDFELPQTGGFLGILPSRKGFMTRNFGQMTNLLQPVYICINDILSCVWANSFAKVSKNS